MRFDVLSIFPEMMACVTDHGVVGRAFEEGVVSLQLWNPRDFAQDLRRTVDDRTYGGGPGMVMMTGPLEAALQASKISLQTSSEPNTHAPGPVILLSPQGRVFNQGIANELANLQQITLVCGRYEAVDQRFIDRQVDYQLSLGDFVISGGEFAAMAVIDAVVRLLPGVLGDELSATQDSFMKGVLDHPHYTRPENYENFLVPSVLLSGHHAKIESWRRFEALKATQRLRPDLIISARSHGLLSNQDELFLAQLVNDVDKS